MHIFIDTPDFKLRLPLPNSFIFNGLIWRLVGPKLARRNSPCTGESTRESAAQASCADEQGSDVDQGKPSSSSAPELERISPAQTGRRYDKTQAPKTGSTFPVDMSKVDLRKLRAALKGMKKKHPGLALVEVETTKGADKIVIYP